MAPELLRSKLTVYWKKWVKVLMQYNACVSSGKCLDHTCSFQITKWCLCAWTIRRKCTYSCTLHGLIGRCRMKFLSEKRSLHIFHLACRALHWTIGHQAIYTSLWLAVTFKILFSTTWTVSCRKKWLGFTILFGQSSLLLWHLEVGKCWFSFVFLASSIFPILLQQAQNGPTCEVSLYKAKYKNRINSNT